MLDENNLKHIYSLLDSHEEMASEEINKISSSELLSLMENDNYLNIKNFLDLKDTPYFLHQNFIQENQNHLFNAIKSNYLNRWNEKLDDIWFVITKEVYKIKDNRKQDLLEEGKVFMQEDIILKKYSFSTREEVKYIYKYEFSTDFCNLYQINNETNLLTKYQLIEIQKPSIFQEIKNIHRFLYTIYGTYKKKNNNIELYYISKNNLNKIKTVKGKNNKLHAILKNKYSILDYECFDSYREYELKGISEKKKFSYWEKLVPKKTAKEFGVNYYQVFKTNKSFKRTSIPSAINNHYPFPKLYTNHLKWLINKHTLYTNMLKILTSKKDSYTLVKNIYGYKNILDNSTILNYFSKEKDGFYERNKIKREELILEFMEIYQEKTRIQNNNITEYLSEEMYYKYKLDEYAEEINESYDEPITSLLFLNSLSLFRYTTKKAINILFNNYNYSEIAHLETKLNRIYNIQDRIYSDTKIAKQAISTAIIKEKDNKIENILNKLLKVDELILNDYINKHMQYLKNDKNDKHIFYKLNEIYKNKWDYLEVLNNLYRNNNLDFRIYYLANKVGHKYFLNFFKKYCKQSNTEDISTCLHNIILPFYNMNSLKELNKESLKNIILYPHNQINQIMSEVNSIYGKLQHSSQELYQDIFKDINFILKEKDYSIIQTKLQNINKSLIEKIRISLTKFLNDEQRNHLEQAVIPIIRKYTSIDIIDLVKWLEEETIIKIADKKMENYFPLINYSYKPMYLEKIISKLLGNRKNNIKPKCKNPQKLYGKINKIMNPTQLIEQGIDLNYLEPIVQIIESTNIKELNRDKINSYYISAKVEDKNSAEYLSAGNASVCCMSIGSDIMKDYIEEKGFSIINIYYKERVIANSLIWKHKHYSILVLDNIEVHPNYKKYNNEIRECLLFIINELLIKMNLDMAVLGTTYNDLSMSKMIKMYNQEEIKKYWFVDGEEIREEDFYSDAETCNIIYIHKEKTYDEVIKNVHNVLNKKRGVK